MASVAQGGAPLQPKVSPANPGTGVSGRTEATEVPFAPWLLRHSACVALGAAVHGPEVTGLTLCWWHHLGSDCARPRARPSGDGKSDNTGGLKMTRLH